MLLHQLQNTLATGSHESISTTCPEPVTLTAAAPPFLRRYSSAGPLWQALGFRIINEQGMPSADWIPSETVNPEETAWSRTSRCFQ